MATITGNTYLDDGTSRTAGEAWTCNGGILNIRTDTRWHVGAPTTSSGSLGAVTISSTLGGGYFIDGTRVRWLPYSGGSGNVPAIGTNITQGGAGGYLLGVWSSLTTSATTVASAMPSTGFIKFREVTGGTFTTGSLTNIGATSTDVDKVGWIEVVHDQAAAITVPRLGEFNVRGDWFELGVTSGGSNQLIQVPTNGSTTAYVPGVWIETSSGSSTYEFYPSLFAAGMIVNNLGTDARSKFVCMETNGRIRIGHNGTVIVGYVPPNGCKIRIPNVLGRQCATASRNLNAIPHATAGTRPNFVTTSAGAIDIENFATDWYLNFSQPYSVRIHDTTTFDYVLLSEVGTDINLDNVGNGISQSIDQRSFNATSCFAGGTINNCKFQRYLAGTTDHSFEIIYSNDINVTNTKSGIIQYARSTGVSYQITQSNNINLNGCYAFNQGVQFTTSSDCSLINYDYCDRYSSGTTTTGVYACNILTGCDNIMVSGVTFGLGGTINNVHPYTGLFTISQSSNINIRNIGRRGSFLSGGTTNNPGYIFVSGGNNNNIKFKQIYLSPTRTGAISTINSDKNMTYEHIYGDMGDTMVVANLNSKVKNCGGTNTVTGQASVYGTHFWDIFTSNTTGRVVLSMNEPTTETNDYITIVSGTPKFTSAGNLSIPNVNDQITFEMDYYSLGHSGFQNTTPTITGTNPNNMTYEYQLDVNSGGTYGIWKTLNGTNLSSETINPSDGFKLKYRITCLTGNTTNLLTYIRIDTTSSLSGQTNNLYPLDPVYVNFTLDNLKEDSEVRFYRTSDDLEITGIENSTTAFTYTYEYVGVDTPIYIRVHHLDYEWLTYENITLSNTDQTIPVSQNFDRTFSDE